MWKLVKYEFTSMKNTIYGILIAIAVMCLLVAARVNIVYGAINAASALVIGFVILIIAYIISIKVLGKYLYDDDGYLLFTLPVNGYEIVGSRLIFSYFLLIIIYIAIIILSLVTGIRLLNYVPDISIDIPYSTVILVALYGIAQFILTTGVFLCTIYFSMVLGKTVLRLRKHEKGVAFLTFIVVNIVINYAKSLVENLWVIHKYVALQNNININMFNSPFSISDSSFSFNMGIVIINVILFAALFIGTSKLIDKGIEK